MKEKLLEQELRKTEEEEALNCDLPSSLKLWTKRRTASVLHVEIKTLDNWRTQGRGPCFVRLGGPRGRVLYREADLQSYIEAAVRQSTSDTGNHDLRER